MDAGCLVTTNDTLVAVPADLQPVFCCQHAIAVAHTTVEGLESIEFEFEASAA